MINQTPIDYNINTAQIIGILAYIVCCLVFIWYLIKFVSKITNEPYKNFQDQEEDTERKEKKTPINKEDLPILHLYKLNSQQYPYEIEAVKVKGYIDE
jgi:uncharacterized ion transporter superfamily protein YfcC